MTIDPDLVYQLALTNIPGVGPVHAKTLVEHFGTAHAIFNASLHKLQRIDGIGEMRAKAIREKPDLAAAEKEVAWMQQHEVEALFVTNANYPQRLLNCYDPPTLLFRKGPADLNASKIVAVVGTRSSSDYGKRMTEKVIGGLAAAGVTVVSGLAYGIDAMAHKASLANQLPTIAVLAHGLDQIYPAENTGLSKEILKQGGALLSEYSTATIPDKHNFPTRNRIVAGMSDAVVVIESGAKGGSMLTAELANGYNRDVFAVPGRITDHKSAGCNLLIRMNKAALISTAADLLTLMGWTTNGTGPVSVNLKDLPALTPVEQKIFDLLDQNETMHLDEINLRSGEASGAIAAAILNLELQNVIASLRGKTYRLNR